MVSTDDLMHMRVFKSSVDIDTNAPDTTANDEEVARAHREAQFQAEQLMKELQKAKMHREIALSLSHFAQQTTAPRGVVLPLFDDIAHLGMSIILELRSLGVDLPVEIPHCGDFKPEYQQMIQNRDPLVRVYDVCRQALDATNVFGSGKKLFCGNMKNCHYRFRGSTSRSSRWYSRSSRK
jgi:hypothetical protein